jgi:hypothetical protein
VSRGEVVVEPPSLCFVLLRVDEDMPTLVSLKSMAMKLPVLDNVGSSGVDGVVGFSRVSGDVSSSGTDGDVGSFKIECRILHNCLCKSCRRTQRN